MRRTLSSLRTFFEKLIIPPICVGGMGVVTVRLFLHDVAGMKWILLVMTFATGAFLYWFGVRMKRVEFDGESLFISNYVKEIVVPIQELEGVSERGLDTWTLVTLTFCRTTAFGRSVVFRPTQRWFNRWAPHPVVEELQIAAERARRHGT